MGDNTRKLSIHWKNYSHVIVFKLLLHPIPVNVGWRAIRAPTDTFLVFFKFHKIKCRPENHAVFFCLCENLNMFCLSRRQVDLDLYQCAAWCHQCVLDVQNIPRRQESARPEIQRSHLHTAERSKGGHNCWLREGVWKYNVIYVSASL